MNNSAERRLPEDSERGDSIPLSIAKRVGWGAFSGAMVYGMAEIANTGLHSLSQNSIGLLAVGASIGTTLFGNHED